jgi:hypothetical protein
MERTDENKGYVQIFVGKNCKIINDENCLLFCLLWRPRVHCTGFLNLRKDHRFT